MDESAVEACAEAAAATTTARRPWWRAILFGLLALYGPTLLPLVAGPLTESASSTATYLRLLPVLPGALVGLFARNQFFFVSGLLTAMLGTMTIAGARRLRGRDLFAAYILLIVLIATASYTMSLAMRA
ncbi:MAG: hypothetical protein AB8H80_00910 [Planctomycetota bacterium]